MTNLAQDISDAVAARGHALPEEVRRLASQAAETDSPIAYAMLGDLIQLLDDEAEFGLADAEAAYQRAIQLDPGYADAHLSLGSARKIGIVMLANRNYPIPDRVNAARMILEQLVSPDR